MAAPKVTLKGILDKSKKQIPYTERPRSIHTPLFMLMTKRGPVDPVYLDIDGFDIFYSLQSLGKNSPWYSHQSELVEIALNVSNSTIVVKRIIDEFARIASTVISIDTIKQQVVDRTTDNYINNVNVDSCLPIITIEAADPGEWGNYVGIEIFKAPDAQQNTIGIETGCVVYEAVVMVEDETTGQRTPLPNIYGSDTTYFTLKPDSIYNGVNYFFDDVMKDHYIQPLDSLTRQPWFSNFHFHVETAVATSMGEDYWAYDYLNNVGANSLNIFRRNKSWFCKGGSDGFPNDTGSVIHGRLDKQRRYDDAVRNWLLTVDETNPLSDYAKYPFSTVWDTGFTKETKLVLPNLQRYRKDVWIACSAVSHYRYIDDPVTGDTVFEPAPVLDTPEAISLAAYYKTMLSLNMESIEYGTPFLRGILTMQDGLNKRFGKKRQSIILAIYEMVCAYCGSSSGKWVHDKSFDSEEYNNLTGWHDVSCTYLPPVPKEQAWDNGVIYAQNKSLESLFFPMFQTVYPNDTSVLNDMFLMMACCHIQHVLYKAWARTTGNTRDDPDEIADYIDDYIDTELNGVFDSRFRIETKTTYNPIDKLNGFSWTTETFIYSNMTRHSATFSIVARRMSDYSISLGETVWR